MDAKSRRKAILQALSQSEFPLSASKLASQFGVSRQVIVGDVALLRAENQEILSTHRGYLMMPAPKVADYIGVLVCQHGAEEVEQELELILAKGGRILDIEVEHPLYGSITAPLPIASREDLTAFLAKAEQETLPWLSSLTGGVHLHRIACQDRETFKEIETALKQAGILYDN